MERAGVLNVLCTQYTGSTSKESMCKPTTLLFPAPRSKLLSYCNIHLFKGKYSCCDEVMRIYTCTHWQSGCMAIKGVTKEHSTRNISGEMRGVRVAMTIPLDDGVSHCRNRRVGRSPRNQAVKRLFRYHLNVW